MKILIIQLSRIGDLIQTMPVISGLKEKYKHAEIHLIARKSFASIMYNAQLLDKLWELDIKDILENNLHDRENALLKLENFIDEINNENEFDQIINLSFSEVSASIATLINAKEKIGFTRFSDNTLCVNDFWSRYFVAHVTENGFNKLHINDIFRLMAKVGDTKPVFNFDLNENELSAIKSKIPQDHRFNIALILSASNVNKSLNENHLYEFLKLYKDDNSIRFILLGNSKDVELAKYFEENLPKSLILNLTGKTTLQELAATIQLSDICITPDTSAIHIASAFNKPIINLSLGDVKFFETGPYNETSLIMKPKFNWPYKNKKAPFEWQLIKEALDFALDSLIDVKKPNFSEFKSENKNVDFYFSKFVKNNSSEEIKFQKINNNEISIKELFSEYNYLLAKFEGEDKKEALEFPKILNDRLLDELYEIVDFIQKIRNLAVFGIKFSKEMLDDYYTNKGNKHLAKILNAHALKLSEVDKTLNKIKALCPTLAPFINHYEVDRDTLSGFGTIEFISQLAVNYDIFASRIEILAELIDTNIKEMAKSVDKVNIEASESISENQNLGANI